MDFVLETIINWVFRKISEKILGVAYLEKYMLVFPR